RSAVENVVRNAIRYTPPGGDIDIALRLNRQQTGDLAEICVRDYGGGVPPESLPRLFEPFYRVPGADSGAGAGLGLAISSRAVQVQGGSITAANATGGGLAITISIPISKGRDAVVARASVKAAR